MKARMNPIRKARSYALTSSETIREATRFPSSRFIHAGCYETVADERDALQARLDEAVALLHRMIDAMTAEELNCDDPVNDACTFLSTLENGGA